MPLWGPYFPGFATAAEVRAQARADVALSPASLQVRQALHVTRAGANQTGATGGINNKIQFTTEVFDTAGWFDNVTNFRYTPQVAGYYEVVLEVAAAMGVDTPQATIGKNGGALFSGNYSAVAPGVGVYVSGVAALVYCNGSTDYIEGYIYLPAAVTVINGGASTTFMTIASSGF